MKKILSKIIAKTDQAVYLDVAFFHPNKTIAYHKIWIPNYKILYINPDLFLTVVIIDKSVFDHINSMIYKSLGKDINFDKVENYIFSV
jgi:hypothetical protein